MVSSGWCNWQRPINKWGWVLLSSSPRSCLIVDLYRFEGVLGNRLDSNYETQSAISGEYLLPIPREYLIDSSFLLIEVLLAMIFPFFWWRNYKLMKYPTGHYYKRIVLTTLYPWLGDIFVLAFRLVSELVKTLLDKERVGCWVRRRMWWCWWIRW